MVALDSQLTGTEDWNPETGVLAARVSRTVVDPGVADPGYNNKTECLMAKSAVADSAHYRIRAYPRPTIRQNQANRLQWVLHGATFAGKRR